MGSCDIILSLLHVKISKARLSPCESNVSSSSSIGTFPTFVIVTVHSWLSPINIEILALVTIESDNELKQSDFGFDV
jgi:hypothetical protein